MLERVGVQQHGSDALVGPRLNKVAKDLPTQPTPAERRGEGDIINAENPGRFVEQPWQRFAEAVAVVIDDLLENPAGRAVEVPQIEEGLLGKIGPQVEPGQLPRGCAIDFDPALDFHEAFRDPEIRFLAFV